MKNQRFHMQTPYTWKNDYYILQPKYSCIKGLFYFTRSEKRLFFQILSEHTVIRVYIDIKIMSYHK